jgi:hypothetical protein
LKHDVELLFDMFNKNSKLRFSSIIRFCIFFIPKAMQNRIKLKIIS